MNKRTFLKSMAIGSISTKPFIEELEVLLQENQGKYALEIAKDESFWAKIREGFTLKKDYINLENGYYCVQTTELLNQYIEKIKYSNLEGSYYMRTRQFDDKAKINTRLAELVGCSADELIIDRKSVV